MTELITKAMIASWYPKALVFGAKAFHKLPMGSPQQAQYASGGVSKIANFDPYFVLSQ